VFQILAQPPLHDVAEEGDPSTTRLLTETRPTLASLDTYALVQERNYAGANLKEMFAQFRAARRETLQMLGNLSEQQLARPGHFDDYGEVTLRSMIHYLCSHDQQHLAGLQWLLGQVASKPR